jgi:stage II sporulation protein D
MDRTLESGMDWRVTMDRVRSVMAMGMKHVRERPYHVAAAAAAVLAVAIGLWSCQSPPRVGGIQSAAMPSEPDVRVRIKQGVPQVGLSGPAEFVLQPEAGKPATMSGPLTVTATPTGCTVKDGRGGTRDFGGPAIDVIGVGEDSAAATLASRIKVDGMSYPGHIRIVPRGDRVSVRAPGPAILASPEPGQPPRATPKASGPAASKGGSSQPSAAPAAKLDVIEVLPVETYLAGVVAAELFKEWPLTAFEVQAVCARTYALHERARAAKLGRDYDLEATTYDQAYNGGVQLPVAVEAVSETRGVVLTWQGRLLRAYYSSTCGGRTASARDIWPTGAGYEFNLDAPIQAHHREVACQASPRFQWDAPRDRAELSKRIREWGKANGAPTAKMSLLVSATVAERNADQRPVRYTLLDDKRTEYAIGAEELRQACNTAVAGLPELTRETKVWASDMEFEQQGTKIVIHGRGFGHGVGMCQYCTRALADRGRHWREIVLGFYPGAALERAY